jgi:hypothetical protein
MSEESRMSWINGSPSFGLAAALGAAFVVDMSPPHTEARVEARCTNSASDGGMINAAIAASEPGDEIVIDGPCLIVETIRLLGNRSYRGESRTGTVLRQAEGANLEAMLASDSYLDNVPRTGSPISVRQMTLDGNDGAATTGIILRSWQSVVEDVQIMNMGRHGIMLSNPSANGTLMIESTSVNGQIVGNFITHSGGHGIFVNEPDGNSMTDWNLTDNWIARSGRSGIYMDNAAGWVIERNHVYGVREHAIRAHRLWGTSIADNYLEGFGETSQAGIWYGINATIQGGKASTIANNRVFTSGSFGEDNPGSTYRYIGASVTYGHGVVSVTGNAIRGTGAGTERGIGLYYARGNGEGLTVASTGNVVTDIGRPLVTAGGKVMVTPGR